MLLDRTFHPDEANQAFTLGRLLETGSYTYNPSDHHGPTLYYAAAPLQKAFGHGDFASLDGTLLRATPLAFSILALVFGALAVSRIARRGLHPGKTASAAAAAFVTLLATAPIFAFFATDFIQEMLLACFLSMLFWAGTGYMLPGRRLKPGVWAILAGIAAGLAFATKETSVLSFASAVAAGFIARFCVKRREPDEAAATARPAGRRVQDAVLFCVALLATASMLFSSFGENWNGVRDAFVTAPMAYLGRATGAASSEGAAAHVHPWHMHLQWLFWPGSLRFSALPLLLAPMFALAMLARGASRISPAVRGSFIFAFAYSALLVGLYSLIPYKTPWCMLQPAVGLAIAAALAIAAMFGHGSRVIRSSAYAFIVMALVVHFQGLIFMHTNPDSRKIPYNYAAASPDVRKLADQIAAKMVSPKGDGFVAVALPAEDTWPLPWYNRALSARTGFWTSVDELVPIATQAKPSLVLVPEKDATRVRALFPHLGESGIYATRPGVLVTLFW